MNVSRDFLSVFDESANAFKLVPGEYSFMVGGSSQEFPLTQKANLQ